MVNYNLIQQIGLDESEVDSLVRTAYGQEVVDSSPAAQSIRR